jgi:peptidoglycan/xylan/chitin deacetylase (PgdA/CDA1 family)
MVRKLLFFILYYTGFPALLRRKMLNNKEIAVLLFHRISDVSDPLWPSMPLKTFKHLIEKLNKTVSILSFSEFKLLKTYPSKPIVLLSFDDGYVDFYDNVMPIFIKLNVKANHNICPGLIELSAPPWTQILSLYLSYKSSDNDVFTKKLKINAQQYFSESYFLELCNQLLRYNDEERSDLILPLLAHIPQQKIYQLMNWDQIKFCAENNIEIGSHGYMHRNLLQILDTKILENEINESAKKIKEKIGSKPSIFAFANAMSNKESKQFVRKSGYQFSFVLIDKLYHWRPIIGEEHIEIPRINISRADWREEYLRALGFHILLKRYIKFF